MQINFDISCFFKILTHILSRGIIIHIVTILFIRLFQHVLFLLLYSLEASAMLTQTIWELIAHLPCFFQKLQAISFLFFFSPEWGSRRWTICERTAQFQFSHGVLREGGMRSRVSIVVGWLLIIQFFDISESTLSVLVWEKIVKWICFFSIYYLISAHF